MKILMVEDNPVVQQQLRIALSGIPGLEVVHAATTAAAAREWLAEHPDEWDLVLIDLFLAQGHGFEVLRQCGQRRRGQKAVVLTNYTRDPVRAHATKAGADAVFDKSLEMEAFVAWCEQLARSTEAA